MELDPNFHTGTRFGKNFRQISNSPYSRFTLWGIFYTQVQGKNKSGLQEGKRVDIPFLYYHNKYISLQINSGYRRKIEIAIV